MTNLDKVRYFQLLKKDEQFCQNNQSFYHENQAEFQELVKYDTIVGDQFYYNKKEEYRLLIDSYLSGKTPAIGFVWIFFGMYKQDAKDLEVLKKDFQKLLSFQTDSKSEGFSDHLDDIFGNCDSLKLDPDSTNISSYEVDENEFKEYLEMIYSKMQKYFDK